MPGQKSVEEEGSMRGRMRAIGVAGTAALLGLLTAAATAQEDPRELALEKRRAAIAADDAGDPERGLELEMEARELFRKAGDLRNASWSLSNAGWSSILLKKCSPGASTIWAGAGFSRGGSRRRCPSS